MSSPCTSSRQAFALDWLHYFIPAFSQLVVPGLKVSAALRVSRQTTVILFSCLFLAAGRFISQPLQALHSPIAHRVLRMRRSIIRTVVHRKHICRAPLPCSLLIPGNFRYLYNASSPAFTDCRHRQIAASGFDKSDESPS